MASRPVGLTYRADLGTADEVRRRCRARHGTSCTSWSPSITRLERTLPRGDYLYEPKWDGFRALAFRDGDWAELQSRNLNRFGRYFPELIEALRAPRETGGVLDGEIVIVGAEGFDFGTLVKRVHPAASRVEHLRAGTPATFVAFDLLALGSCAGG